MTDPNHDPEVKAAARALVVAADRLHRAIAAASPEQGRDLLATLMLAGAVPVATVRQLDVTRFDVHAGLLDLETNKNLETFAHELVRTDASPMSVIDDIAH